MGLIEDAIGFERQGKNEEAVSLYCEAGDYERAGLLLLKVGDNRRAAQLFWKGGSHKKAAECLLRAGAYAQAGEAYEKAGEHLLAAKAHTQARDPEKAAAAYEAAGKLEEAARMYMLAHSYLKAGGIYEKLGDTMRSALAYEQVIGQGEAATPQSPEEMGKMAKILERVQQFEKAAKIYVQMQQVNEALIAYLKAGDLAAASRLYASCQGNVGWEILEVARRESPDRLRQVAEMFFFAKDFDRSGEAFLALDDHGKAARAYEAGGDYPQAAGSYMRAGERKEAARMYEKAGQHQEAARLWKDLGEDIPAAQCFERQGAHYDAAELYFKAGHMDRAIELFQRVPDTHPHFLDAVDHVAAILKEKGYVDLAIERYRAVIQKAGLNEETLPLHYHLALIFLERGATADARAVLMKIAGFRLSFRDTEALLKRCDEPAEGHDADKEVGQPPRGVHETLQIQPPEVGGADAVIRLRGFESLQEAALLQELTLAEIRIVLAKGKVEELERDAMVIRAGDSGRALYILLEGLAKVTVGHAETEEILGVLVPGEHFGEMSLLDDSPTSANVVSVEPGLIFKLDREAFGEIMASDERLSLKFFRAFIRTLSQRLRKVNEELAAN